MLLINSLTDAADQLVTVPIADGSILQLEFIYRAGVQRWFMNISHPKLTMNGFGLTQGPNILRQWRNIIPFGIAVKAVDLVDPIQTTDFETGRCLVYVLSAAEVQTIEQTVYAPPALVNV